MKTALLSCVFLVLSLTTLKSQNCSCSYGSNVYPLQVLVPNTNWQQLQNQWAGEASEYIVDYGNTYQWSYCSSDGGSASVDLRLNLFDGSSNIDCNGDYCSQDPKISWTATYSGIVRVQTNQYFSSSNPCGTNSTNGILSYRISNLVATNDPDLIVSNAYVDDNTLDPGQSFTVYATTLNQGQATSDGASEIAYYFESSCTAYPSSGNLLSTDPLNAIGAGDTEDDNDSETLPTNAQAGSGYIVVYTDYDFQTDEGNSEGNNYYCIPITVNSVAQLGSIMVTVDPTSAVNAGAQWKVDNGSWNNSGDIQSNLTVGTHTVYYSNISGWNTPPSETVGIIANACIFSSGTYTSTTQYSDVVVNISPITAVQDGARWRIDGGSWKQTGDIVSVMFGSHTIDYLPVSGWNEPASQTISVNSVPSILNATYTLIGAGCGYNSYPYKTDTPNATDAWWFQKRQCTSYAAWKVNEAAGVTSTQLNLVDYFFHNTIFGSLTSSGNCTVTIPNTKLSNACYWDDVFVLNGFVVDYTPEVGAIGYFAPYEAGPGSDQGHVAYVEEVNGSIICISDYNYNPLEYNHRPVDLTLPISSTNRRPSKFLHFGNGVGGSTGISQITYTYEKGVLVYPNPSDGIINVLFDRVEDVMAINVFNSIGQVVFTDMYNSHTYEREFDFSTMPAGYYILETIYNDERIFSKFLLK